MVGWLKGGEEGKWKWRGNKKAHTNLVLEEPMRVTCRSSVFLL